MKILIKNSYEEISEEAAGIIIEKIKTKKKTVLGLATGSTPIGLYKELIKAHKSGIDFSEVITFNLDEYLGLSPEHEQSYNRFMFDNLFNQVNIKKEKIN